MRSFPNMDPIKPLDDNIIKKMEKSLVYVGKKTFGGELTTNKVYKIENVSEVFSLIKLQNDKGYLDWYNTFHFRDISEHRDKVINDILENDQDEYQRK